MKAKRPAADAPTEPDEPTERHAAVLAFEFSSELFVWQGGQASWYFIRVPVGPSQELREQMEGLTNGFGSIRVEVAVEESVWRTSLFPDSSSNTYLLPVKKQVRRAAEIEEGDVVDVSIVVLLNESPHPVARH